MVNGTTTCRAEIEQQHAQMKARILGRLRNLPLSHAFSERAPLPSLPPLPLPIPCKPPPAASPIAVCKGTSR